MEPVNSKFTYKEEEIIINSLESNYFIKRVQCVENDETNSLSLFRTNKITSKFYESETIKQIKSLNFIYPNQLKLMDDLYIFTFLQLKDKKEYQNYSVLFLNGSLELLINLDEINYELQEYLLKTQSNNNSGNNNKNISKIHIYDIQNREGKQSFSLFLLILDYVFILRIIISDNKLKYIKQFEKHFKEEGCKKILFIGSDNKLPGFERIFLMTKPSDQMLVFSVPINTEFNESLLKIEEKPLLSLVVKSSLNPPSEQREKEQVYLSRPTLPENSNKLFFYENNSKKLLLFKKKLNNSKIKKLAELELKNFKNYLIITDTADRNNIYAVTDEIINKDTLILNLWKIVGNLNHKCEKIQSVYIKGNAEGGDLGDYRIYIVKSKYIIICFYEHDSIFIISIEKGEVGQNSVLNNKSSHSSNPFNTSDKSINQLVQFKNIYEIKFDELYGVDFTFELIKNEKSEEDLIISSYETDGFRQYILNFSNNNWTEPLNIKINESIVYEEKKSVIISSSNSYNNPNDKKKVSIAKVQGESNSNNKEKKKKFQQPTSNNKSDYKSDQVISNFSSNNNQKKMKFTPQTLSPTKISQNPQKAPQTMINTDSISKTLIEDIKQSLGKNLMSSIEGELDIILNKKITNFSETLTTKLSDVFSFMKKQTEELEEMRKRNNEAMSSLTHLILNEKGKNKSSSETSSNVNTNPILSNQNSTTKNQYTQVHNSNNKKNPNLQLNVPSASQNVRSPNPPFAAQQLYRPWGMPWMGQMEPNNKKNAKGMHNWNPNFPYQVNPNFQGGNNYGKNNNINLNSKGTNSKNPSSLRGSLNHSSNIYQINSQNNNYNNTHFIPAGFNNYLFPGFGMNFISTGEEMGTTNPPAMENKYKEDELIPVLQNLDKKMSEITDDNPKFIDANVSIDLNNAENKQEEMNYSSDSIKLLKYILMISFFWKFRE
jgi:hypothetical protein